MIYNMKLYIKVIPFLVTFNLIIIMNLTLCYLVSVSMGHVYPLVPYISETGDHPPESSIFTITNSICSICFVVCAWFCSQQVENKVNQQKNGGYCNILATNKIGYHIGIFTAGNLFAVSHIQEMNLFTIHMITALSFFVGSALFLHFNSSISGQTQLCTPFIAQLRRRQARLHAILVFLTMCFGTAAILQLNGKNSWDLTPADNGHLCHALSAICEYAAVLNLAIYVLTFCKEALHLSFQLPEVYLDGFSTLDRPSEEYSVKSLTIY